MRSVNRRTYFVILRWDTDRPSVYLEHYFPRWERLRLWVGAKPRPKARFACVDLHGPEAHRFISRDSAQLCCDMPDLARQKNLLSITELRDL